jgi:hypothetical protein
LTYSGSWNPGYSGVKGNGVNTYADTYLIPSSSLGLNNSSFGIYNRTSGSVGTKFDYGTYQSGVQTYYMYLNRSNIGVGTAVANQDEGGVRSGIGTPAGSKDFGMFVNSRIAINSHKLYRDNIVAGSNSKDALQNPITNSIIFGAWRFTFTIQDYSDREYSFFHIGDGLTDYEAKALYWIVQKFQTTLGRQVY